MVQQRLSVKQLNSIAASKIQFIEQIMLGLHFGEALFLYQQVHAPF